MRETPYGGSQVHQHPSSARINSLELKSLRVFCISQFRLKGNVRICPLVILFRLLPQHNYWTQSACMNLEAQHTLGFHGMAANIACYLKNIHGAARLALFGKYMVYIVNIVVCSSILSTTTYPLTDNFT